MVCNPEIPCSILHTAEMQRHMDLVLPPDDGQCRLCGPFVYVDCTMYYAPGKVDIPVEGHGTKVTPLNHGPLPRDLEPFVRVSRFAAQPEINHPANESRGHFVLRNYAGHWGLEMFSARQTVPHPLAIAVNQAATQAVRWFFDPQRWLFNIGDDPLPVDPEHGQPSAEQPLPARRQISAEEISERIAGYQVWLDKEELRLTSYSGMLVTPPLVELPPEQQRRLVYHWDRLWNDFLDLHPDWNWTPALGFWKKEETIFPLKAEIEIPHGEGSESE